MGPADLKHYGKPLTGLVYGMPAGRMNRLMFSIMGTVRAHLGTARFPLFLIRFPLELTRLSRKDTSSLRAKGLRSDTFLKTQIRHAAFYSAALKVGGAEKAERILDDIAGLIDRQAFSFLIPAAEEFHHCGNAFTAFKEWLLALTRAEAHEGTQRFEVAEDSTDAFQLNCTQCMWYEIPRTLGLPDACLSTCSAEDLFFPALGEKIGMRYRRTGTLPQGSAACDFRFERVKS